MDTRRWSNVCQLRDSYASGEPRPDGGPIEAFLEISARCNLRCRMCAINFDTRYQGSAGRPAFLKPELFERLRPIFPTLGRAHLYGLGEPVLNPWFTDYIRDLSAAGVETWFTTNATLIDEEKADGFARAGADRISISIDGTTAETYEKIRRGASFAKLMRGLRALARARRRYGKPRLTVNFVAMESNVRQLPSLVELCSELGVEEMNVEPLFYWGASSPELKQHYQSESLRDDRHRELMADAQKLATDYGIHFRTRFLTSQGSMDYRQRTQVEGPSDAWVCSEPWSTIYVTVAGEVRTCCINDESFGNLFEQPFNEIWNGGPFTRFRNQHYRGDDTPDGCGPCLQNGRKRHSPYFEPLEEVSYRPLLSASGEPSGDPGFRFDRPYEGEVVVAPLILTGHLPADQPREHLDRFAVLIDHTPVELLSTAVVKDNRFRLICRIPFVTEGAHVVSFAARPEDGKKSPSLGWNRRLVHLWHPPRPRRQATPIGQGSGAGRV